MPRIARVVVPGIPHHITQRGNDRQTVFFTEIDREEYLALLDENARRFDLRILAYCLMPNHVHLVAIPRAADGLAKALGRTHFRFAQRTNRMLERSGHLWQNRFFSCPLDEEHCLRAIRYVERNPVRARLVRAPWRFPWSSALAHCVDRDKTGILDLDWWRRCVAPADWRGILRDEDESLSEEIRHRTLDGRPMGSDEFVSAIEADTSRNLRRRPVGRPPQQEKET